jgi:hypothetical protein
MYCWAPTNDRLEVGTNAPRAAICFEMSAAGPDSTVLMITSGLSAINWAMLFASSLALRWIENAAGVLPCFLR